LRKKANQDGLQSKEKEGGSRRRYNLYLSFLGVDPWKGEGEGKVVLMVVGYEKKRKKRYLSSLRLSANNCYIRGGKKKRKTGKLSV